MDDLKSRSGARPQVARVSVGFLRDVEAALETSTYPDRDRLIEDVRHVIAVAEERAWTI